MNLIRTYIKNIWSSVCVARTSYLLQIFLATTAAHVEHKNAPAQTKGPSSPATCPQEGLEQMCYTRVQTQGEHTVVFMHNAPPRLLLGNSSGRGSVFYSKSHGRVFLPAFPMETGIPEFPSLCISSSQEHSH